ncbi:MAG: ankyrin repeat domain-containing protein [Gammaproteobacteria bacterium]|nr:ankyrin repeat domain-containing protein [Gammaproteobacteria bacterium]
MPKTNNAVRENLAQTSASALVPATPALLTLPDDMLLEIAKQAASFNDLLNFLSSSHFLRNLSNKPENIHALLQYFFPFYCERQQLKSEELSGSLSHYLNEVGNKHYFELDCLYSAKRATDWARHFQGLHLQAAAYRGEEARFFNALSIFETQSRYYPPEMVWLTQRDQYGYTPLQLLHKAIVAADKRQKPIYQRIFDRLFPVFSQRNERIYSSDHPGTLLNQLQLSDLQASSVPVDECVVSTAVSYNRCDLVKYFIETHIIREENVKDYFLQALDSGSVAVMGCLLDVVGFREALSMPIVRSALDDNDDDDTPFLLERAIKSHYIDVVSFVMRWMAPYERLTFFLGHGKDSLLHLAAKEDKPEVIRLLCSSIDTPEVLLLEKNNSGETALHTAVQSKNHRVIQTLYEEASKISVERRLLMEVDHKRKNVFHFVAARANPDTLKFLCELAGEQWLTLFEQVDSEGNMPLEFWKTTAYRDALIQVFFDLPANQLSRLFEKEDIRLAQAICRLALQASHLALLRSLCCAAGDKLEALLSGNGVWENNVFHTVVNKSYHSVFEKKILFEHLCQFAGDHLTTLLTPKGYFLETILHNMVVSEDCLSSIPVLCKFIKDDFLVRLLMVRNHTVNTALHLAVNKGYSETVGFLCKKAADVQCLEALLGVRDGKGRTVLHCAIEDQHLDVMEVLCESAGAAYLGTLLKTKMIASQKTALHLAVECSNDEMIRSLLKKTLVQQADLFWAKNLDGKTALECVKNLPSKVKLFFDAMKTYGPAFFEAMDDELAKTVLDMAMQCGHADIIRVLCQARAHQVKTLLMAKNERGYTKLHLAIVSGNTALVKAISDIAGECRAALVMAKNNYDKTALELAHLCAQPSMEAILNKIQNPLEMDFVGSIVKSICHWHAEKSRKFKALSKIEETLRYAHPLSCDEKIVLFKNVISMALIERVSFMRPYSHIPHSGEKCLSLLNSVAYQEIKAAIWPSKKDQDLTYQDLVDVALSHVVGPVFSPVKVLRRHSFFSKNKELAYTKLGIENEEAILAKTFGNFTQILR